MTQQEHDVDNAPPSQVVDSTAEERFQSVVTIPAGSIALEREMLPEDQMAIAKHKAKVLFEAVEAAGLSFALGGKQKHLGIQAWQMLGKFDNATPRLVSTKKLEDKDGNFYGYEATQEVVKNGVVITSADAMCTRDEPNWNDRRGTMVPEFQLRSMAQTRAASKALRMAYGWIAVLAGYSDTPKEEMTGTEYPKTENPIPAGKSETGGPTNAQVAAMTGDTGEVCPSCGGVPVKRSGKFGDFFGCSNYPTCKHIFKNKR